MVRRRVVSFLLGRKGDVAGSVRGAAGGCGPGGQAPSIQARRSFMLRTPVRARVLGGVVGVAGCGVHTPEGVAKALVSDEQEAQLGAQVKQELDKQGTKYVQDPEIVNYVQGVAKKIFVPADKDRPGVK